MRKISLYICLLFVASCILSFGCVHTTDKKNNKKPHIVQIPAGSNQPSMGFAVDASYDSKLDNIVPGYKILTVAITNNSIDIIPMDRDKDKWQVIDSKGSKHQALTDFRGIDSQTYLQLPEKLKQLIEYPLWVQVGETRTIDLLFKDSAKLDGFKSVRFDSVGLRKSIEIMAND